MRRSRKSIVTLAAALAGVLAMAGVAAAAHGRSASKPSELVHRSDHSTPTLATGGSGGSGAIGGSGGTGGSGATGGTGGSGVTTTTEAEHARPEPGDDNGEHVGGHDVNDDHGQDVIRHDANDDHGQDGVAHDVNDDHGDDATTTSQPDATTTTVGTVPDGMRTFAVAGGTVTVDVEGGVLSLVSATPNAGFAVDKSESRSDRVEVEFRGDNTESRVRVRVEDGRLQVESRDH